MATLSTTITNKPSNASEAVIIPQLNLTLSYPQLINQITSFQTQLAELGIQHGDAVAISLPNSLEFIVSFLGAAFQRAIAAPLNPAYKQSECEFYISDLVSRLVLVPWGAYDASAPVVLAAKKFKAGIAEVRTHNGKVELVVKDRGSLRPATQVAQAQPTDIALVLHTSGTTGRPKAVPLTHANLTRTMTNIVNTYKLSPQDRTYLVMPLFHVHGLLAAFLAPLYSGGTVIIPARFSASHFWNDFIKHKANWYTAVPSMHQILLRSPLPPQIPPIRFIRSCSSPLAPAVFEQIEKTFKAPVLEAYAMTEAAHQMTSNPLPPAARKPGSVGLPQGIELKILNTDGKEMEQGKEGEICIRGPNVTDGYLNNPTANSTSFHEGRFFRTGDQGKLDADGYVIITGRIKELINRGGEKISPVEIDNVLAKHPNVAEAVTFALEDEVLGQDVGAAVVVKEEGKTKERELKDWVAKELAKFKVPKKIWFTKVMPKTATGKIQRRLVAEAMVKSDAPAKAKL
ncbi:acetyl-CoA synthetase-like protein [Ascobolus immersus RN42]|uniref:Acetyl-CoA synthetase-like protein n=1 Tax=Ascobolus immersus RN42 TaxID=1160509 RepID=A0A3N4HN80_ASCIM|nr:acetyl-CoA synthetase-like protein [Ascobolus immersus RN42]